MTSVRKCAVAGSALLFGGALSLSGAELPRVQALVNARIVTAPGTTIEKGTIVFRRGVIEAVGASVAIPRDATVLDLSGRTVYPGLIDPYVTLSRLSGKKDKPADEDEGPGAGRRAPAPSPTPVVGNVHAVHAVRAERRAASDVVLAPEVRDALRGLGFAVVQAVPDQGVFRGRSAVLSLGDGAVSRNLVGARTAQVIAPDPGGGAGSGYPGSKMGGAAVVRQAFLDARWDREASAAWIANPAQPRPEHVDAWTALADAATGREPVFIETSDVLGLLRAGTIAKEFGLTATYVGAADAYRLLDEVKVLRPDLVLSLNFPAAPSVDDDDDWIDVPLDRLRAWDRSASNPRWMKDAGLTFSLTTHGLAEIADLPERVRRARARGLSEADLLAGFTTVPAKQLGLSDRLGVLAPGKAANLIVVDGTLFDEKSRVLETWVDGERFEAKKKSAPLAGIFRAEGATLELKADRKTGLLGVTATPAGGSPAAATGVTKHGDEARFTIDGAALGVAAGPVTVRVFADGETLRVEIDAPSGRVVKVAKKDDRPEDRADAAERSDREKNAKKDASGKPPEARAVENEKPDSDVRPVPARFAVPLAAPKAVFVRNGTVWTSGPAGVLEKGNVLVVGGKVVAVGRDVAIPANLEGVLEIDAAGKAVTPGLVDCHSHTAIDGGVNEGTNNVTAEVRIGDVLNPFDVGIYRELAGGLTAAHTLHGSANAIGGQDAVIKLRFGAGPDGLKAAGAVPGIKFALGENPKQSNWGGATPRYPQTRMGVSALIRERFLAARDYRRRQQEYEAARSKKGANAVPPKPDLQLEAVAEILEGKRLIHSHAYVKQEMLDLIRLCDEFGVRVATFQHVLEGYKIADEIARHGAGASSFSDWWAYKFEVYDAIPYNGALMRERGVVVSFNSDSNELARRLNVEAAKAVEYGGVPRDEALKFVTWNAAKQLGLEKRIGSLEPGKDGDFVVWSGDPLSSGSVCLETWIDGKKYFDRNADLAARKGLEDEKAALIAKARLAASKGEATRPGAERPRGERHGCLDEDERLDDLVAAGGVEVGR